MYNIYKIDSKRKGKMEYLLPRACTHVKVPPLKIQGIKTKLVPFIMKNIMWDGSGVWIEPFMGSGVVGFNVTPKKAIFSDSNPHIIRFYKDIQSGSLNSDLVRDFLEEEAPKLAETPPDKCSYYYTVRSRFNSNPNSLDFIFLQRSNFNGMMRFGPNGYNVPFGRKPDRFKPALITKIVNQVKWVESLLKGKDWKFINCDWSDAISAVKKEDFIYLDPPYIGRNADYFNSWTEEEAAVLAESIQKLSCGFALSMWLKNKYRANEYINCWDGDIITNEHYYFVGGKELNRNAIIESIVVKRGFVASMNMCSQKKIEQGTLL